ncbi:MAG: hypothetical protein K8823_1285 [Cenarchaeum symbiont of Oopsacas minuta]|nr:hypothetical protein [Cenarchaeum symbiont of Oopsacas minuta]
MARIPKTHPRATSLLIREKLVKGFDAGLVAKEGLLAHGRGEAFDYMLGEKTSIESKKSCRAAVSAMLLASHPIISVNGNVAALCGREMVALSKISRARLEVNVFYSGMNRREKIAKRLVRYGASDVLGADLNSSVRLSRLDSARATVDRRGIAVSDLVLVSLEDGDRTSALKAAGKTVIAIDLNPLSRTAQDADITIVDNLTRSTALLVAQCKILSKRNRSALEKIIDEFDNKASLASSIKRTYLGLKRRAGDFA